MNYENLDQIKSEIEKELAERKFAVFYTSGRSEIERDMAVPWNTLDHPDFRKFLAVAEAAAIKIIVVQFRTLLPGYIADLGEQLEELDLDRDERRNMSRDLQKLKMYEGFTASIDLSFDQRGQTYSFSIITSWFKNLMEIAGECEMLGSGFGGEDVDDDPLGGNYFSKN
jgi:hypothetical protein